MQDYTGLTLERITEDAGPEPRRRQDAKSPATGEVLRVIASPRFSEFQK